MSKSKNESIDVAIIGVGYVGLVSAGCFAELGHRVRCYDIDAKRIEDLKKGWMPFFEPKLGTLIKKHIKAKRIHFFLNLRTVVEKSKVIFICVGTPARKNGSVDLSYVKDSVQEIAKTMRSHKIIVIKSTVPAGTSELVRKLMKTKYKGLFDVVSNPEFLQEGRAIDSFLKGDRVVLGFAKDTKEEAKQTMKSIYQKLTLPRYNSQTVFETNNRTAEMAKYACNAFLSTEISFINNIANLCDEVGADVKVISEVMKSDNRIGSKAFLNAGAGYGGICFPKDMRGLINAYQKNGYDPTFFKMVEKVNTEQRSLLVKKAAVLLGSLKGKTIAVLGLSFKPDTDDIRDAPSITIIQKLLRAGANVRVCDPVSIPSIQKIFKEKITYNTSVNETLRNADAMILVTEWEKFQKINFQTVKKLMRKPNIVDGRNIYNPEQLKKLGFKYKGVGRS